MTEHFLSGERVLVAGVERPAALRIASGRIAEILPREAVPAAAPSLDVGPALLMPGVVDTHVHINDPGRTAWEGFETATRAAAAGGITSLVDMPLNAIPVTTSLAALEAKLAAARGRCWVDCAFWGGVVPGNAHELAPMVERGVLGFKAFLCPSGIDDFPQSREADLRPAMTILARLGVPLLVHAELEGPLDGAGAGDPRHYATYLASRPRAWENAAVRLVIRLARETGCRVHIVHLSSADVLSELLAAKREGVPVSAETCPHYLVFASEDIPDGATAFKCAPPIREASNREKLWQGLAEGAIDFVACDHSPCTPDLKHLDSGDFMRAWGGVSSVQFALPVVWTHARARGFELATIVAWLCGRTAAFAGWEGLKGTVAVGAHADLVAWHPDRPFSPDAAGVWFKHPISPYLGQALRGVVERTFLRGEQVFGHGAFTERPTGRLLGPRGRELEGQPS